MIAYLTVFFLAFWKFMFTPTAAFALGLGFYETLIWTFLGALVSVTVFYFFARYFMRRAAIKRFHSYAIARTDNLPFRPNDFTKLNKSIVHVKRRIKRPIGCIVFPLFLSLPLGTIVASKFYRLNRSTYKWLLIGVLINSLLLTFITYLIFNQF